MDGSKHPPTGYVFRHRHGAYRTTPWRPNGHAAADLSNNAVNNATDETTTHSSQQTLPGTNRTTPREYSEMTRFSKLLVMYSNDLDTWSRASSSPRNHGRAREIRQHRVTDKAWKRFVLTLVQGALPGKLISILQGHFPAARDSNQSTAGHTSQQVIDNPTTSDGVHLLPSDLFSEIMSPESSSRPVQQSTTIRPALLPRQIATDSPDNVHFIQSAQIDRETTLFAPHVLELVVELAQYRIVWDATTFQRNFGRDHEIFESEASSTTMRLSFSKDVPRLWHFKAALADRVHYISRFSRWYAEAKEGFPAANRPFIDWPHFSSADLTLDAYLFRTGILDEQYARSNRPFRYRDDILCQMYGLGLHELACILDEPNEGEKVEYIQTLETFHTLTCVLGPTPVEDIAEQTTWVSFAVRNHALALKGISKAGNVFQTRKAKQREFTITKLLVDAVVNNIESVAKATGRHPCRSIQQQWRCTDGSIKEGDWDRLPNADKYRLLGYNSGLIMRFIGHGPQPTWLQQQKQLQATSGRLAYNMDVPTPDINSRHSQIALRPQWAEAGARSPHSVAPTDQKSQVYHERSGRPSSIGGMGSQWSVNPNNQTWQTAAAPPATQYQQQSAQRPTTYSIPPFEPRQSQQTQDSERVGYSHLKALALRLQSNRRVTTSQASNIQRHASGTVAHRRSTIPPSAGSVGPGHGVASMGGTFDSVGDHARHETSTKSRSSTEYNTTHSGDASTNASTWTTQAALPFDHPRIRAIWGVGNGDNNSQTPSRTNIWAPTAEEIAMLSQRQTNGMTARVGLGSILAAYPIGEEEN
ncbi:uncharacterized protein B0I36DRAFT_429089 [Microdochium trichocladiopsis]|uniref:Uncharacterized protein n=1 Tax=Microdochium trichocladiopsis TaxID=1682393 RepID=A0A9P8Y8B8_9PEZI|nr:uncharacterized protein B0I36DRAFT_429089 [Microdochium trichocladiopsis]KAH7034819.1 hypothetical protein B0I36DRAFT_429089 [Microdochium trichocladiopsis]